MLDGNEGQEPLVFYSELEVVLETEQADLTAHFWPLILVSQSFQLTALCLSQQIVISRSGVGTVAALWGWVILETGHGEWRTCLKAVWGKCSWSRKTNDYRKQQELRRPGKACCVHRPQGSVSSFYRNDRLGAGKKYVRKEGPNFRWCFPSLLSWCFRHLDSQMEGWQDSGTFLRFHPLRLSPCFIHVPNLPF